MSGGLLDHHSLERGLFESREMSNLKVSNLIQEVLFLLNDQFRERGIRLKVIISEMSQQPMILDAQRLQQVLLNVISNSMKFAFSESSVTIKIDLKLKQADVSPKFVLPDRELGSDNASGTENEKCYLII